MFISRAIPRSDVWDNPQMLSLFKSSYAIHQAVWGFFLGDKAKSREFLYRYDLVHEEPVIYIVSKDKPVEYHGVWKVDTKEYSPCIEKGDLLSFSVRVNPVVTKSFVDEKTGKSIHKRHDVIMDYKYACRKDGKPFSYDKALATAGVNWLVSRGEKFGYSVALDNVCAESYDRRVFDKSGGDGKKHEVVVATLDLKGVLEVTDPELFVYMLFNGIGPAKGFGCGLMLVKRYGWSV